MLMWVVTIYWIKLALISWISQPSLWIWKQFWKSYLTFHVWKQLIFVQKAHKLNIFIKAFWNTERLHIHISFELKSDQHGENKNKWDNQRKYAYETIQRALQRVKSCKVPIVNNNALSMYVSRTLWFITITEAIHGGRIWNWSMLSKQCQDWGERPGVYDKQTQLVLTKSPQLHWKTVLLRENPGKGFLF